jgi:flagellar biosynthesis component FlhA
LGAGLATATLYPQQLVNMTLRPQQFFDNAYSTALKATVTQVEKPKWEEFKEKAEAVEEAIVEKVENAEQAVVHTAAEITEHIKEQAKEDATAIVENLQAVAEHVTEVVKQEGTDLPTEKNE